ncbi:dUTP diphosphatase [Thermovibrio ammonificans]|jgi:dUTP pyrophosphatase
MSNWAAGWVYGRGLEFELEERFADVALKLARLLGASVEPRRGGFLVRVETFPKAEGPDLSFVRGLFESAGSWGSKTVYVPSPEGFRSSLSELLAPFGAHYCAGGFFIRGEGANLFLHSLYDEEPEERSEFFFEKFLKFIAGESWERTFFSYSLEEGALPPYKKRVSDSGFDLHLIRLVEKRGNLYFFDTGVRVSPPPGYYFDLVPRSSIFKSGFMLANSVGIIDMTYRGTVKVPLVKVDPEAPEPELPWRAVQLIPRRFYPLEGRQVATLDPTLRGEGGFGSTG